MAKRESSHRRLRIESAARIRTIIVLTVDPVRVPKGPAELRWRCICEDCNVRPKRSDDILYGAPYNEHMREISVEHMMDVHIVTLKFAGFYCGRYRN